MGGEWADLLERGFVRAQLSAKQRHDRGVRLGRLLRRFDAERANVAPLDRSSHEDGLTHTGLAADEHQPALTRSRASDPAVELV